jgi:hypothetical protein
MMRLTDQVHPLLLRSRAPPPPSPQHAPAPAPCLQALNLELEKKFKFGKLKIKQAVPDHKWFLVPSPNLEVRGTRVQQRTARLLLRSSACAATTAERHALVLAHA